MALSPEQRRSLERIRARLRETSPVEPAIESPVEALDPAELLSSLKAGLRRPSDLDEQALKLLVDTYGSTVVLDAFDKGDRIFDESYDVPAAAAVSKAPRTASVHHMPAVRAATWWPRVALIAASILLAVMATLFLTRRATPPAPAVAIDTNAPSPPAPSTPAPPPTVALELKIPPPLPAFLAVRLSLPPLAASRVARARGSQRDEVKASGTIVSVDGGVASLDVGLIDGVSTGSVLIVEADPAANLPERTATVTMARRNQATAEVPEDVGAGRRVRIGASEHLLALSRKIDAGLAAGDERLVRSEARRASTLARTSAPRANLRRSVLMQLSALAKRDDDTTGAEQYAREAVELADRPPIASKTERAELLNALGTLVAARDLKAAAETLALAQRAAPAGSPLAGHILNNLGAVAALSGEPDKAETFYTSALALLSARQGRSDVERNLSLLGSQR